MDQAEQSGRAEQMAKLSSAGLQWRDLPPSDGASTRATGASARATDRGNVEPLLSPTLIFLPNYMD